MPAFGIITAADAAATPVNHNFEPTKGPEGIDKWVERTTNTQLAGQWALTFAVKNPKQSGGVTRVTLGLSIPIVVNSVVNGVTIPAVDRTARFFGEFIFPANGSEQERKDIVKLVANLLNNATMFQALTKPEGFY